MKAQCTTCGKEVNRLPSQMKRSKTGNVYCSRNCATINNNKIFKKWENHPHYKNGKSSYRKYKLNSVQEPKCEQCGFENILALDVHHKDRNRNNNQPDNLEVLCPNCHEWEHKGISVNGCTLALQAKRRISNILSSTSKLYKRFL